MATNRMPPLNALRAFEATARHLSVKKAAEELCVTAGAVSQMLKTLERHLGVPLFHRVNRGVVLTDAGQAYLAPVRNAFSQIADATRRVAVSAESGALTVSVTPAFATGWLVPRLGRFQAAHPEVDLQIHTGKALIDFSRDGVDVAVRHGLGRYIGLRSDRVFSVELVPVAAPSLVERLGKPSSVAELTRWPHLHDAERQDWHLWFNAQGITEISSPRGTSFDDTGLLLAAAIAGQGAALIPAALAVRDLVAGRLVRLSDAVWPEEFAYYFVCPEENIERPKIAAFRDWVIAEAAIDYAPGPHP